MLKHIYETALDRCAPERLIARFLPLPRTLVAIGKCAGALLDGTGSGHDAFAAIPRGYRKPAIEAIVHEGGHPDMTAESFAAGRALIEFVDAHDDVAFLISGGGSACVDVPLPPFSGTELIDINRKLVDAGIPIGEINCVRKHLSAIKGGRLGARVRGRCLTLVHSDVSTGALADVASGPTLGDPTTREQAIAILRRLGGCDAIIAKLHEETPKQVAGEVKLIADNTTLVRAAADVARELGYEPVVIEEQIETDVDEAAKMLLDRVKQCRPGFRPAAGLEVARAGLHPQILIAGGEPTVVKQGDGKGGRCSELAVRLALLGGDERLQALFGSSDGVDGNSGVAGIEIALPAPIDRTAAARELARSNSFAVAATAGEAIMISHAGNNLRDLYLLARG